MDFRDDIVENQMLRKYYLIGVFFGGIGGMIAWGWWFAVPLLLLQVVYIVWLMTANGSFEMIRGQVEMVKSIKKEEQQNKQEAQK